MKEDKVSAWWKKEVGEDEHSEGRALKTPWYSWQLWDRRRKWDDYQQENEEYESRAQEADDNTYNNSKTRNRTDESRASSSDEPCGLMASEEPYGFSFSEEPCGSNNSADLLEVNMSQKRGRKLAKEDIDELLSYGSKKSKFWRGEVVVPKNSLTPGQILRLERTGVKVVWEGSKESDQDEPEPLKKRVRTWRDKVDVSSRKTSDWREESEDESDKEVYEPSSDESDAEIQLHHKGTYTYQASGVDLLEGGMSPKQQAGLAKAIRIDDDDTYKKIVFEVNTKYKPVGKKILPIAIALPPTSNPPLRRPPMSRDPYSTPLTPNMPEFVAGGRLTEERVGMMDFGPEGWLSSEERNLILNVLRLREKALAFDGSERGKLKSTYADPYKIPVVPHTPWRQTALPIPLAAREKIIETFKSRMKEGLYERSTSAYSGRWFVVAKKDGKYRIVHDLQPLNAVTIRDAGLPPIMEDFVEDFTGRSCLGLMDILGGFDQRELADESRDLTTFQTPLGPVRLTRLPQGGTTSVAEFQRIMVHILAEEIPQYAGVFVDDVGIKGPESTYDNEKIEGNPGIRRFIWEYAITLERILFRFEEAGITGSGQKAAAIVPALNIVGTVVSMEGRRVSKSTMNKISNFPVPQDVSEVRGFLGICTYVRIWIKDFANIARPLRELTKKDAEFIWEEKCQQSFEKLKTIVGEEILLTKIKYGKDAGRIILSVDSSHIAAGGIIFQEDSEGRRRPARYESLTFTATESRYSQPKLELAGVAKMLKKLQMFLWGQRFILEVDASALVQMINAPELPNAPMNRWLRFIQLFDFEIVHVAGKTHTLADGLSRARRDSFDERPRDLDSLISAHVSLIVDEPINDWEVAFVEADYEEDPGVLAIGKYLSNLKRPTSLTSTQFKRLQNRARGFALDNGKLYRRKGGMFREVVLDKERQHKFLQGVHDETGHRGREETARRVSDRAWWPGWSRSVKDYVQSCDACQRRKPNQEREARKPSMSAGFFRKFNFDVTHIKEGSKPYLLTCREDLTGWVEGRALNKITSAEVSKFIKDVLIPRFGWFYQATLDGGAEFKGEVITALKEAGIKRIIIAPNHPEANGQEERGHQELVNCLVKITDSPKAWAKHLPMVLFADRISMRRTTGMTPFAMVYGTEAVLPVDQNEETWIVSDWRDEKYSRSDLLKARFDQLERKSDRVAEATGKLLKARLASVIHHDRVNSHRLRNPLLPGALVLVHNAKLDTLHGGKFIPRWTGPYRVRERLTKGSYLLEELDETPMKKVYAARRIRRYYPRGRNYWDAEEEVLTEDEDEPEDIWDGDEDAPMEDLDEGRLLAEEYFKKLEEDQAHTTKAKHRRMFALPDEEDGSVQEKETTKGKEKEPTSGDDEISESSESSEDARPTRVRRSPSWLLDDNWDARRMQKKIDHVDEPSEDESMPDSLDENPQKDKLQQEAASQKRRMGRPSKNRVSEQESTSEEDAPPQPKKKRGRPKKSRNDETGKGSSEMEEEVATPKRKVGRPRKLQISEPESSGDEEMQEPVQPLKRGRGRPRKAVEERSPEATSEEEVSTLPKRRVGRPRKTPMSEDEEMSESRVLRNSRVKAEPAKRGRGRPRKT
ncbi:hypothetical protein P7C70_g6909, partial [Phenoliferia sp. Uapishka_3]